MDGLLAGLFCDEMEPFLLCSSWMGFLMEEDGPSFLLPYLYYEGQQGHETVSSFLQSGSIAQRRVGSNSKRVCRVPRHMAPLDAREFVDGRPVLTPYDKSTRP